LSIESILRRKFRLNGLRVIDGNQVAWNGETAVASKLRQKRIGQYIFTLFPANVICFTGLLKNCFFTSW